MKSAKQFLMVAGAFAIAVLTFSLAAPRAVHAAIATLVQVANTSANPVPNQAVDSPTMHPVMLTGLVNLAGNVVGDFAVLRSGNHEFVVPAGKRFFLQSVSAQGVAPVGQGILASLTLQAASPDGGTMIGSPVVPLALSQIPGSLVLGGTQEANGFSDPGYIMFANLYRTTVGGTAELSFTVIGYLVDCPGGVCPIQP
jgi:hypothetical protein